MCPIVLQCRPSNLTVTRAEKLTIWIQFEITRPVAAIKSLRFALLFKEMDLQGLSATFSCLNVEYGVLLPGLFDISLNEWLFHGFAKLVCACGKHNPGAYCYIVLHTLCLLHQAKGLRIMEHSDPAWTVCHKVYTSMAWLACIVIN